MYGNLASGHQRFGATCSLRIQVDANAQYKLAFAITRHAINFTIMFICMTHVYTKYRLTAVLKQI
jgi:hypothetical protein